MNLLVQNLWLVPALPLFAAGAIAVLKQRRRALAASLAIGSMALALVLSCAAFVTTLGGRGALFREARNFDWFALGDTPVRLGRVLAPPPACLLVMATFLRPPTFTSHLPSIPRHHN